MLRAGTDVRKIYEVRKIYRGLHSPRCQALGSEDLRSIVLQLLQRCMTACGLARDETESDEVR
jgi:hypothetical protein